ncbi:hypothetical protein RHSIM_Rhsim12G0175700 [Rhododendron simsii]|uniref:Uncharacterized protein n=1 Tax=Rhododendron simsii TaxID=118357 RepID=A0A834L9Q0_RHOSS|nr:hypothetical protein RHSIM_Rhsim12G0175700 [Rhododendron simsii]
MTGEEVVGPAGPKLVRLLYFVGAGCNDLLPLLLPYASTIDQFSFAWRRSTSGEIFNGIPFNYRRSRPMRYRKQLNDNQSPRVLGFHQSSDNFTAAITYYHKHCKGFHIADKGACYRSRSSYQEKFGDLEDSNLYRAILFLTFRKEMNKGAKKLIKDLKQIDNKIASLPLLDQQLEDDHHVTAVIRVPKAVSSISVSVYNSLQLFFSPQILKPRVGPNCWTKVEWRVKNRR